ncbi:MAG: hypothetical protein R3C03_19565 [Pirellulaceae bacterium]
MGRKIEEKCKLIAATPEFGDRRPEYGADIHLGAVGRYVIFFRPIENGIEVAQSSLEIATSVPI